MTTSPLAVAKSARTSDRETPSETLRPAAMLMAEIAAFVLCHSRSIPTLDLPHTLNKVRKSVIGLRPLVGLGMSRTIALEMLGGKP